MTYVEALMVLWLVVGALAALLWIENKWWERNQAREEAKWAEDFHSDWSGEPADYFVEWSGRDAA